MIRGNSQGFRVPKQPVPPELRLGKIDGGLCNKYIEPQLNDNQSPYMLNMTADDRGALIKRFGQSEVFTFDEFPIHNVVEYKDQIIVAHGTKLSVFFMGLNLSFTICTDMNNEKGTFFIMNDTLYYLNGRDYLSYDGDEVKIVEGYIPTTYTSIPPSGGGTRLEPRNYLSAGFKNSFSGDGTAKTYKLSEKGLDSTQVTAMVDNTLMLEGNGFTVNRTEGTVTFTNAPSSVAPNNVLITAYKTVTGHKDNIMKCKYSILYGGTNDTRVFIAGNIDKPNQYFYSDLYRADYFPEFNNNKLGSDFEAITGFAVQYDTLVIFKEKSIYSTIYSMKDDGLASFPTRPINSSIGCDMPYTIQIVDNNPVFANTYAGVHMLLSTQVRDQRNVKPISGNVNGAFARDGLLNEDIELLKKASSINFDYKYYLCVDNRVYVWDYGLRQYFDNEDLLAWFFYNNIQANCFVTLDRKLYIGHRYDGRLVTTNNNYVDFGEPIPAVWRSKMWNFNLPDFRKTITEIWFTTRTNAHTKINVKYMGENGSVLDEQTLPISNFNWAGFSWDNFSFEIVQFMKSVRRKPKLKNTMYFQIEFSNEEAGNNLSILSLIIRYTVNRKVK